MEFSFFPYGGSHLGNEIKIQGGRMNKKLALAFLIISFLVGDAYGMTAGEWMTKYKKPASAQEAAILLIYIRGISEGIEWMDAEMQAEYKVRLYCIPDNLALTLDQKINMLKVLLDVKPFMEKVQLGLAIKDAYVYAFPCKELDKSLNTPTEDDGY